jgi:hypothetical protein
MKLLRRFLVLGMLVGCLGVTAYLPNQASAALPPCFSDSDCPTHQVCRRFKCVLGSPILPD